MADGTRIVNVNRLPERFGIDDWLRQQDPKRPRSSLKPALVDYLTTDHLPKNHKYLIDDVALKNLRARLRHIKSARSSSDLPSIDYAWKLEFQTLRSTVPGIQTFVRYDNENHIDAIMWMTFEQQGNYKQFNDCIQVDDTFKVCNEDAILFEGCVRTGDGFLASCFQCLHWHKTCDVYKFVFASLDTINNYQPSVVICDEDAAIMEALTIVWPETQIQNCYFHVKRSIRRHYMGTIMEDEEDMPESTKFIRDLDAVAFAKYTEKAFILMDQLIEDYGADKRFKSYMIARRTTMNKWAQAYKVNAFNFGSSTTGDIERQHGIIKKYLAETTLRHLSQLPLAQFFEGTQAVLSALSNDQIEHKHQLQKKATKRRDEDIQDVLKGFERLTQEWEGTITTYAQREMQSNMIRSGKYSCNSMGIPSLSRLEDSMLKCRLPSHPDYKYTADMCDNQVAAMHSTYNTTVEILELSTGVREYVTYIDSRREILCSCCTPITIGLPCEHIFAAYKHGAVPFHIKMINARWTTRDITGNINLWLCGDPEPTIIQYQGQERFQSRPVESAQNDINDSRQKLIDMATHVIENIDKTSDEVKIKEAIFVLRTVANEPVQNALDAPSSSLVCSSLFGTPVPKPERRKKDSNRRAPHAVFERASDIPLRSSGEPGKRRNTNNSA
jgi:hypothetical protein